MARDYAIEKTSTTSFKITTTATQLTVEVKKIPDSSTDSSQTPVNVEPTIVNSAGTGVSPTASVYTLALGDYYVVTLDMDSTNNDGVYYIEVNDSTSDYKHIFISTAYTDELLKQNVTSSICCQPIDECKCGRGCAELYDFSMLSMISMTYFGESEINVNFNYGELDGTAGLLTFFDGYEYKAVVASGGAEAWNMGASNIVILYKPNTTTGVYEPIGDATTTVANTVYHCVHTGFPDTWGTNATFTALTSALETRLNYIADAMARVEDYNTDCDTNSNGCSCS